MKDAVVFSLRTAPEYDHKGASELAKLIEADCKIISEISTHTRDTAIITYILVKEEE